MNDRLRKKRFKERWHIKRVPRRMNIRRTDKILTYTMEELTRRLAVALDNAVIYGKRGNDAD